MRKSLFAIIVSIALCAGLAPVHALAAEASVGGQTTASSAPAIAAAKSGKVPYKTAKGTYLFPWSSFPKVKFSSKAVTVRGTMKHFKGTSPMLTETKYFEKCKGSAKTCCFKLAKKALIYNTDRYISKKSFAKQVKSSGSAGCNWAGVVIVVEGGKATRIFCTY